MFRFPDKPCATSVGILDALEDGQWLAQLKYDGWRAVIDWDGNRVTLTSRHREGIPATTPLRDALTEILRPFPPLQLDGEWMGRRDQQPEKLWVFDFLASRGVWEGGRSTAERWQLLWAKLAPRLGGQEAVEIPESAEAGYRGFFELSKQRPGCEGIVLKHCDSKFVGSVRKCVDNPLWLKVKWRDGANGHTLVA